MARRLRLIQADAFTKVPYSGNPAAVVFVPRVAGVAEGAAWSIPDSVRSF